MTSNQDISEKRKMAAAADLMRKGATLLNEACPRCGGVQIEFQGKIYCINEDDINQILSSPSKNEPLSLDQPAGSVHPAQPDTFHNVNPERETLRKMLEEKLAKVSKELEKSEDPDQQTKLLALISKYVETLEKL